MGFGILLGTVLASVGFEAKGEIRVRMITGDTIRGRINRSEPLC